MYVIHEDQARLVAADRLREAERARQAVLVLRRARALRRLRRAEAGARRARAALTAVELPGRS